MAPLVIVCSSRRGAPTVFKSVLPVLDATLDQPGTAMQTRHRPGARGVHGVDLEWNGVNAALVGSGVLDQDRKKYAREK